MSHASRPADEICVNPLFAGIGDVDPRWRIPDGEMLPETAYQIIHDEMFLDGTRARTMRRS